MEEKTIDQLKNEIISKIETLNLILIKLIEEKENREEKRSNTPSC